MFIDKSKSAHFRHTYMDNGCCVGLLNVIPSSADSPPELLQYQKNKNQLVTIFLWKCSKNVQNCPELTKKPKCSTRSFFPELYSSYVHLYAS